MHVVHQHDTTCYTGPRHDTNTYHTMARYQAIPMHVILLHDTNCNAHNIPWYQCMACMHMVYTNTCHAIWHGIRTMHVSLWQGKNACLTTEWYQ